MAPSGISRLLDGGTADRGLPYIVMEYIDGPWITTYATQHKLGVEVRLRLLLTVCSAVDYAHRNFIVHRDLKPGNILVDPAGVPKLLDFGICKLLVEAVTGLTYAALLHRPVRPPGDRENALSWLSKAADAWRAAQSDGALASPDRREMRQVEEALTRIERDDRMVDRISPEGLMMTRDQRELVRLSLDRLSEEADPVTLLLYGKLFELDLSVRRLFHNDFTAQGGKLMDTLDAVVSSLDHFESLRPRLAGLGRLHASYGVRPAHYDALITALLWAFGQALGADVDARTREAWRLALAAKAAVMQEGAATAE